MKKQNGSSVKAAGKAAPNQKGDSRIFLTVDDFASGIIQRLEGLRGLSACVAQAARVVNEEISDQDVYAAATGLSDSLSDLICLIMEDKKGVGEPFPCARSRAKAKKVDAAAAQR
jgi:hypothetical protein